MKSAIALLFSVLVVWAGAALADDFAILGKLKIDIHPVPINLYQGSPMDSVLVIRGKIDMGQTDYYSVLPVIGEGFLMIDGKPLETMAQDVGINKADFVPQFKSSAAAGWAIYLYAPTGANPNFWQKFKAMNNVAMTSLGAVRVTLKQGGSSTMIPVVPGQGAQMTKPIGPVQPK